MKSESNVIRFERKTSRDWRFWGVLAFGLVFAYAGLTIDPATNCSESGECAPILVPIGAGIGFVAILTGLSHLLANASRGSEIDLAAGRLRWWQGRTRNYAGDHGEIALADIALIRIRHVEDQADVVSLFDHAGQRQPWFDEEVLPWRRDAWLDRLTSVCPHIRVERID